jgi:hypothetical protein
MFGRIKKLFQRPSQPEVLQERRVIVIRLYDESPFNFGGYHGSPFYTVHTDPCQASCFDWDRALNVFDEAATLVSTDEP